MLNLNDLKIGDTVHFANGQVAKVDNIELRLSFDKEVASDACDSNDVYDYYWYYDLNGEIVGLTNHIVEIIKKGEENVEFE